MNNAELKAMLRQAQTPPRPPEYWENFPQDVIRNLGRAEFNPPSQLRWWTSMLWGTSLAFACVTLGFFLGRNEPQLASRLFQPEERFYRQCKAVPSELCVMLQDDHGLEGLVTDTTQ